MKSPNSFNRWIVFVSLSALAGVSMAQVTGDEAMREVLSRREILRA